MPLDPHEIAARFRGAPVMGPVLAILSGVGAAKPRLLAGALVLGLAGGAAAQTPQATNQLQLQMMTQQMQQARQAVEAQPSQVTNEPLPAGPAMSGPAATRGAQPLVGSDRPISRFGQE